MSVRVVARIRPLLKSELEKDTIVEASSAEPGADTNIISIPNPKNSAENFSFQFNSVYDQHATQQELFDKEVSSTVKHLFNGFDVTIFAYGVTGTGKTHTMRGGKMLADRGVIPRLLSSIYRRGRKIEKDSEGDKTVEVSMSYYEIYNDKVFDLFESPEKRTAAGLPIRDHNGKTIVAGLTERPCTTLKDFESLYDQANVNRSTSATKLNAHSSRSHAILCVKVSQITEDQTIISTASAIDLAGSEDNRRTENGKERLVESSSINKSLFVLAQCVEAISKKHSRIPYRESKMTRILSLGQNNGLTVMILNLAPVRSYHLDTLSSLNFANRTKKIEVREIENEPIFKGPSKVAVSVSGQSIQRQPLKPLPSAVNATLKSAATTSKPTKSFSVYTEQSKPSLSSATRREGSLKRGSDALSLSTRPNKIMRPSEFSKVRGPELSRESIEELVNRMVDEKLANRALEDQKSTTAQPTLSADLQKRLDALEQRVEKKEDARADGLQYLLMAKQHHVRGEEASALKMYQLALPYFPDNEKLAHKMLSLQEKLRTKRDETHTHSFDTSNAKLHASSTTGATNLTKLSLAAPRTQKPSLPPAAAADDEDASYIDDAGAASPYSSDAETSHKPKPRKTTKFRVLAQHHPTASTATSTSGIGADGSLTPRTAHLLRVVNSRDLAQIRGLKGVGAKKAEAIVSALCEMESDDEIMGLEELGEMKGIGVRAVEVMRSGVAV